MKKIVLISVLILILISALISGCSGIKIKGSGNLVNEEFDLSDFINVQAQNGFKVEVTKSNSFSVVVTVDENALDHIEVKKSGDTLIIRPEPNCSFSSVTMKATVTMPDIRKIDASGGARVEVKGFDSSNSLSITLSGGSDVSGLINTGDLDAKLSGGSHLDLSNSADSIQADLSGGSHITLSGHADSIDIKGSGGSHFNMAEYSVKEAEIDLSGGSHADLNVRETMKGSLSGSSTVKYTGDPTTDDLDVDWDSELNKK